MATNKTDDALLRNIKDGEIFPISFKELEDEAKKKMSSGAFGYIQSGAGGEETLLKIRHLFRSFHSYRGF